MGVKRMTLGSQSSPTVRLNRQLPSIMVNGYLPSLLRLLKHVFSLTARGSLGLYFYLFFSIALY
jgi:hypothetical protein